MLHIGHRIELLAMPDDPCPIDVGTQGTVTHVQDIGQGVVQVMVDWDNGRTLSLIMPPDQVRRLS